MMIKHEHHSNARHFLGMMHSLGLYLLIDKSTRITDISATLIDNIFTNELRHHLMSGSLVTLVITCQSLQYVNIGEGSVS